MKKARNIGALLGMLFGLLGLLTAGLLLDIEASAFNTETAVIIVAFMLFAALYGAMVGGLVFKGKCGILFGVLSSFLTTISTIIVYCMIHFLQETGFNVFDLLSGMVFLTIYSVVLGGIPIAIIGGLFGWIMKLVLKRKIAHHEL